MHIMCTQIMLMLYPLYILPLFSLYPQEVVLETEFEEERSKFTMKQVNFHISSYPHSPGVRLSGHAILGELSPSQSLINT